MIFVVGSTGSGKTTLMYYLNGYKLIVKEFDCSVCVYPENPDIFYVG